jgi:CPA1 family monovalent cation:H+ antiporter
MRGCIIAARLSIPVVMNGVAVPQRNLILFITFVVILSTLLIQGLTTLLDQRTRLFETFEEEAEELVRTRMKQGLKHHVYQFLKDKHEKELHNRDVMDRI